MPIRRVVVSCPAISSKALVEAYQENSTADDVTSTPTFLINGEKHPGNMPFEQIAELVDAQL